jgi:drug/metabolite transporter (DMT)-like permease
MVHFFPIALAVGALTLYHVCAKAIAPQAHPLVVLLAVYATAFACTAALLPLFPLKAGPVEAARHLNWAVFALGAVIVAYEVGAILAYRAGWEISLASVLMTAGAAALLLPIGLVFFGEHLSPTKAVGLLFAVVGVALISR